MVGKAAVGGEVGGKKKEGRVLYVPKEMKEVEMIDGGELVFRRR